MQSVNKKLNNILDSKAKQEDYDTLCLEYRHVDKEKLNKEKLDKVREKERKCRKRRCKR